jgi:hypothetical protein
MPAPCWWGGGHLIDPAAPEVIAFNRGGTRTPVAPNGQFHQLMDWVLRACGERELERQPDLFAHWKWIRSTI